MAEVKLGETVTEKELEEEEDVKALKKAERMKGSFRKKMATILSDSSK